MHRQNDKSRQSSSDDDQKKWKVVLLLVGVLSVFFLVKSWDHLRLGVFPSDDASTGLPNGHKSSTFENRDCSLMCPMNYAPVCGSDGMTYSNECRLKVAACVGNADITVVHEGKCEPATGGTLRRFRRPDDNQGGEGAEEIGRGRVRNHII
eukprot:TRINITY_DN99127_c0_g1_i1.p1 TRINITY_DN99127_c0_g1~~TRINITY_DN99127_c0_g1_i1.p1  ORF type:complete len:151 (-),score=2.19 TRINITY_DN99127_c0_g1_i1:3-455(-)